MASVTECEPDQVEEYDDLSTYLSIEPVNCDIELGGYNTRNTQHNNGISVIQPPTSFITRHLVVRT